MDLRLSQDQIDFYHENGYLVLDRIMSDEEVEWMRGIYDRLFEMRAGREKGDQFDLAGSDEEGVEAKLPQILGPSNYAPEILQAKFHKTCDGIVKQLLGPEASAGGDHAILKPAKIGVETPWHQDEAYWDPAIDYRSLSIWIPLQEATIENGCMWFIPGSHLGEVQPHHSIGNDPRVHGLEIDTVDASNAVACPILAGACTIHHSRTMHYTGPNLSDQPRRAYILGGGAPGTPREDVRDFYWNRMKQTARAERANSAS